ncbi:hypothetical protein LTR56_000913 [Elasticomyces elasticus]|nr:hypothetical protein LTR56_000913 [Elasticomyces elasticus]KAK3665487.1 hypothetical protein LTR22_003717 [Elasticomyces elasticus]KAK5759429.1 hypothetical protein LTS12_010442 [Elasticomyces elasticus]
MEEREADAKAKATRLMELVGHDFFDISFTIHPAGLTGEAPGKSSNESWAAKQIMRKYSSQQSGPEVVVTIMDADSHLSPRYFAQIFVDYMALSKEERAATFYVSPIVFDRNSHQVPLLVRTADVVWSGAGISTMYAGSSVCIPTSVYSVPLRLVERTQGWDTGYTAIGEDMHMYLKCFFAVSGRLRSKVIYTAASQCNVCSGDLGIRGYAGTVAARYQQALRHMWGMLDTGYALRHATAMLFLRARFWWCHGVGRRTLHHLKQQQPHLPSIHKTNMLTMLYRLLEAHILPLQLVVALTSSTLYDTAKSSRPLPSVLRVSFIICRACRLLGFGAMILFVYRYRAYHYLCVELRRADEKLARKLGDADNEKGAEPTTMASIGWREAVVFPVAGVLFGAIPALQATLMHLYSVRLVYTVSLKPLSARTQRSKSIDCESLP